VLPRQVLPPLVALRPLAPPHVQLRHPRPARRLHKPQLRVVVALLPPRPQLLARPQRRRLRRRRCRLNSL
jgi:hypothetical protein